MNGVVLIAINNPIYGQYAYNMALSIRCSDEETPIQLICNKEGISTLTEREKEIFYYILLTKENNPALLKLQVCRLSDFETTLFFDADSLLFPGIKLEWLFYELDYGFYAPNGKALFLKQDGEKELMFGGKFIDYCNFYKSRYDRLDQISSHFMFFQRDHYDFFEKAEKVYKDLQEEKIDVKIKKWRDIVPDELAFGIATNLMYPMSFREDFHPMLCYWDELGGFNYYSAARCMMNHWGITVPTNPCPNMIKFYNFIISLIEQKTGKRLFNYSEKV